mmetsp:Transcript_37650/g.100149  ORF Transcript_37650/g.100149 Transcript_37650/m.100149 type:complete len:369 (+) Transcript_37650:186-1292(+)
MHSSHLPSTTSSVLTLCRVDSQLQAHGTRAIHDLKEITSDAFSGRQQKIGSYTIRTYGAHARYNEIYKKKTSRFIVLLPDLIAQTHLSCSRSHPWQERSPAGDTSPTRTRALALIHVCRHGRTDSMLNLMFPLLRRSHCERATNALLCWLRPVIEDALDHQSPKNVLAQLGDTARIAQQCFRERHGLRHRHVLNDSAQHRMSILVARHTAGADLQLLVDEVHTSKGQHPQACLQYLASKIGQGEIRNVVLKFLNKGCLLFTAACDFNRPLKNLAPTTRAGEAHNATSDMHQRSPSRRDVHGTHPSQELVADFVERQLRQTLLITIDLHTVLLTISELPARDRVREPHAATPWLTLGSRRHPATARGRE